MQYQKLAPMLLNELQNLDRRNQSDHQRLEAPHEEIRLLKSRLAALEEKMESARGK